MEWEESRTCTPTSTLVPGGSSIHSLLPVSVGNYHSGTSIPSFSYRKSRIFQFKHHKFYISIFELPLLLEEKSVYQYNYFLFSSDGSSFTFFFLFFCLKTILFILKQGQNSALPLEAV